MRTSQVDARSKRNGPVQFVSERDDNKPEAAGVVAHCANKGSFPQLVINIRSHLWHKIGSPPRVDVSFDPQSGFSISPGSAYKLSTTSRNIVKLELPPTRISLSNSKRPLAPLTAQIMGGAIVTDAPPDNWIAPDGSHTPEKKPTNGTGAWATSDTVTLAGTKRTAIRFRIPMTLLAFMGRPDSVTAIRTATGFEIHKSAAGNTITSASNTGYFDFACSKLSIAGTIRPTVRAPAEVRDGVIYITLPDQAWAGDSLVAPPPVVTAEPPQERVETLPNLIEAPERETTGRVSIAVRKNTAGIQASLKIPLALLVAIDSPKRIYITGTVHTGFVIAPAADGDGVAVPYVTSSNVYMTLSGLADKGISKEVRDPVLVHAEVKEGKIKISGPPQDWVKRLGQWYDKASHPDTKAIIAQGARDLFLGVAPGQSRAAPTAAPAPASASNMSAAELQVEMSLLISRMTEVKAALEASTGLKLMVTRNLQIALVPLAVQTTGRQ